MADSYLGRNPSPLSQTTINCFTTSGTAPLFVLTPIPALISFAPGAAYTRPKFNVKFHANGAGGDSLNISGLGTKLLKQFDQTGTKVPATIYANMVSDVEYDGTDLIVLDPIPVGGATGGSPDKVFFENDQIVTTNYTITAGKNAMSAGPISINTGVTVTVGTGSTWSIV